MAGILVGREPMKHPGRIALVVFVIAIMLVASISGSYYLSVMNTERAQHRWCRTLTLLTHEVVEPPTGKINAQEKYLYQFYVDLKILEGDFGC